MFLRVSKERYQKFIQQEEHIHYTHYIHLLRVPGLADQRYDVAKGVRRKRAKPRALQ